MEPARIVGSIKVPPSLRRYRSSLSLVAVFALRQCTSPMQSRTSVDVKVFWTCFATSRRSLRRLCLHLAVQDYQLALTASPANVRHCQIHVVFGDSLHYISELSLLGRATIADYLYSAYFHLSFHSPSLFRIDSIVHTGHGAQRP
ncbi:hypothetical protein ARMGADRAFT_351988 [Armillaria gallica]|uniref:Uncharacterized protein n=1 Tax=Armillaria gallica TaxID=47427 RepID=A0A2H3D5P8_ARMGA|nr:hypothetical protein ARMGADRAFT_351988 [Armillaria gallica]